jgi:hypothetical protein
MKSSLSQNSLKKDKKNIFRISNRKLAVPLSVLTNMVSTGYIRNRKGNGKWQFGKKATPYKLVMETKLVIGNNNEYNASLTR